MCTRYSLRHCVLLRVCFPTDRILRTTVVARSFFFVVSVSLTRPLSVCLFSHRFMTVEQRVTVTVLLLSENRFMRSLVSVVFWDRNVCVRPTPLAKRTVPFFALAKQCVRERARDDIHGVR